MLEITNYKNNLYNSFNFYNQNRHLLVMAPTAVERKYIVEQSIIFFIMHGSDILIHVQSTETPIKLFSSVGWAS